MATTATTASYVYVSDDYGQTWRAIVSGLPSTGVNRIREHPGDAHFLVLGHEKGVHFSTDDGRTWTSLSLLTNFPTAHRRSDHLPQRARAFTASIWILTTVSVLTRESRERRRAGADGHGVSRHA
jgi:hypothetical protein